MILCFQMEDDFKKRMSPVGFGGGQGQMRYALMIDDQDED